MKAITVTVNGASHTAEVEERQLLVHFLREQLGLTGTNVGCDTSSCGACTVHVDGESVKSCSSTSALSGEGWPYASIAISASTRRPPASSGSATGSFSTSERWITRRKHRMDAP